MKSSAILGLNARSYYSYRYNKKRGKRAAASKLLTKKTLKSTDIPVPHVYFKFRDPRDILKFDWTTLPPSFALKPSKGLGGEGIIIAKKRSKSPPAGGGEGWITTQRKKVTVEDLKLQILDILEGAYSVGNVPDVAFFEEYVGRHKTFRKYAYRGTPDIRVIVFNKVPIMAMLRLPTRQSGGRANLHQGAIGVGVDIATGITTNAILYGKYTRFKPGTKRKLHGIKIPYWRGILETAVRCSQASDLGYVGVDLVLHPEKGPMVLEINSQPGLQIQLANKAGLKKRLERLEDLEVRDAEHGVRIAKSLFAERFADRVKAEEGIKTIKAVEEVKVGSAEGKKVQVLAKIDTGAWNSSIDKKLARELGLYKKKNILWYKRALSSLGREERPVINLTFWLAGRKIRTTATVADRGVLTYRMIVGRRDLTGFLVNPEVEEPE